MLSTGAGLALLGEQGTRLEVAKLRHGAPAVLEYLELPGDAFFRAAAQGEHPER